MTEPVVHAREAALSLLGQVLGLDQPDVPRLPLSRPDTGSPGGTAGS